MLMLSLVRCRLSGMIVAQAMIALLVRNENSADGRPFAFLPASTALMRPLAPAGVTSTRGAHAWGASGSRETIRFGLNPACPSNSLLRLRQMGKPCGKTLRTASDDESRNLPAGDAARTEEFRRVGSEDAGREKDEEDEDSGAKEALESESRKVEGRSFFDPSIRATTEKLRLLVQSGKVIGRNTWLKQKMEIENSEAERIENRPLVVQELRAAAEELKLQGERLIGLRESHGKEVLDTKRGILSETLRKKDCLIEKMLRVHGQSNDGLAALVKQEAGEIDNEFFMRVADTAESIVDVNERGALLEMGVDVALAWDRAEKDREREVPISRINSIWPTKLLLSKNASALSVSVSTKLYWNESYERCTYEEVRGRFAEWLDEYNQDRAEHEKARSAHPHPTTLDAEFTAAFREVFHVCSRRESQLESIAALTDMLLGGARATRDFFVDHELSSYNLGTLDDFLRGDLGTRLAPGVAEFFDALAASASVTLLTNRVYVGNGGMSLWECVLIAVTYGSSDSRQTPQTPVEELFFRRASFRLLVRMTFLSAEREVAVGSTHRFLSLLQAGEGRNTPFYPAEELQRYDLPRRFYQRTPENFDAILHVMYLAVFMYRHYPWRPEQRYRVDADIAKILQDNHSNGMNFDRQSDLATSTLRFAATMPGFYQALLEDDTIWLLLAAYGLEGENAISESNFVFASALQLATRGRGMGRFSEKGFVSNQYFRSRQGERELTKMLRNYTELSTWFCGPVGRSALLDICRQRRRRVLRAVAAGAPSAFAAIVPELLTFTRGPGVRGKKERLVEWLESRIGQGERR